MNKPFFPLLIIFLLLVSCTTALRVVGGFKNPKVETKSSINNYINDSSFNDEFENLYFNKLIDSTQISSVLLRALSGEIIIFDTNGNRKCYNGNETCSAIALTQIETDFESTISDCDVFEENYTYRFDNLESLLGELITTNNKNININQLPKMEYYIVYNWSIFSSSKKRNEEDYAWFKEKIKKFDKDIYIIKINCDLREDWGLKKNKKLKFKLKKQEDKTYELTLGRIPFEK